MLIHSTVLANGMRIVIAEYSDSPVMSAGVFVRQGSRNEGGEESGISHFLEHLLFNNQRAIRRGKRSVQDLLNNGGMLNAHTSKECTSFEGYALKQHAKTLLTAIYEMIFECDFTEEDVEAERQIILAELKRKTHGSDQILDYLAQGIFADTGYGNWILGKESFISGVGREQLLEKYKEAYVADNVAVVVVTSEPPKAILQVIEELFSQVPSGIPTQTEVPITENVHLKVLRQRSEQVFLCLGGVAPSLRDEGSKCFEIAMAAFGSIPNSRLFLTAREEHGLVYQIQSIYYGYVQTGYWGIYSTVAKDKFPMLMDVLAEEIHRLRTDPFQEEELNRTVSVLKTNLYTRLQQPDYFLRSLGRREIFRESIFPNDTIRQYELATTERILQITAEYIRPLSLSVAVMGDLDAQSVLQTMNKFGE